MSQILLLLFKDCFIYFHQTKICKLGKLFHFYFNFKFQSNSLNNYYENYIHNLLYNMLLVIKSQILRDILGIYHHLESDVLIFMSIALFI